MIEHLGMNSPNISVIGQSKVFFKAGQLALLEQFRDEKLTELIVNFQVRIFILQWVVGVN